MLLLYLAGRHSMNIGVADGISCHAMHTLVVQFLSLALSPSLEKQNDTIILVKQVMSLLHVIDD